MSEPSPVEPVTAWDWLGVALIAVCAAFAALLEALLVPLYIGSWLVPIAVVLALVSNVALPRMAKSLVPTTLATLAPFGAWLIVMLGFGSVSRPEGDVILPGSPGKLELVTYGVLLGGALVGTATIVWLSPPPATKRSKR
jgi:hypothetical protein